ncbi:MAG: sigma-70 family RNA polymerase sigma factor [Clostridia bacterium]|nr:sigma-70 family RNA polymerase sigma factor [Clostridia bacterium]
MKTIQYKFNDGSTKEISVTDELYALHLELLQEEKRNHWKETRRHISLEYLMEQGVDIADHDSGDPLSALIEKTDDERIKNALSYLTDKQRALIEKVFYNDLSLREIARQTGVSHQALSQQLATIYKKLKKFL